MNTIFHICCNFTGNKVHSNLIVEMAQTPETIHWVFVPCSNKVLIGKNYVEEKNVNIVYFFLPRFLRFFPILKSILVFLKIFLKIRKMNINPLKTRTIAYTFWSDGVVAYYLYKILKIKFIVAVRSTDFNVFFKYGFHLKFFLREIYLKANYIYSPNIIYQNLMIKKMKDSQKIKVLPNPLSHFWLGDIYSNRNPRKDNLFFVGDFNSNKNILSVCLAVGELIKEYPQLKLTCVGGTELELKEILNVDELPTYINVLGYVKDAKNLKLLYREHKALVVPSFKETFGMVYLEALSQGCQIIYSKGQGVDGFFHKDLGCYAVDPYDLNDLKASIKELINKDLVLDFESLSRILEPFNSANISEEFYNLLNFNNEAI